LVPHSSWVNATVCLHMGVSLCLASPFNYAGIVLPVSPHTWESVSKRWSRLWNRQSWELLKPPNTYTSPTLALLLTHVAHPHFCTQI
jgi:hypothetical protein